MDDIAVVEAAESNFKLHTFSANICELPVQYQVLKMDGSLFIWIGQENDPNFNDLSLASYTRYDKLPITTKLFGDPSEVASNNIAMKLTKKYGKPVYVSFNLPTDRFTLPAIEKQLFEEIKENSNLFE